MIVSRLKDDFEKDESVDDEEVYEEETDIVVMVDLYWNSRGIIVTNASLLSLQKNDGEEKEHTDKVLTGSIPVPRKLKNTKLRFSQ